MEHTEDIRTSETPIPILSADAPPDNIPSGSWQEPEPRAFKAARVAFILADIALLLIWFSLGVPEVAYKMAFAFLGAYYIGFGLLCYSRRVPVAITLASLLGLIVLHYVGSSYVMNTAEDLLLPQDYRYTGLKMTLTIVGLFTSSLGVSLFIEKWRRKPRI